MATPKKIQLETLFQVSDDPFLKGDKNALMRVFNNLLSNAIKFTPKGGKIQQILEEADENHIRIRFIDNGIGIPADKIPFLFDKYSKTSQSGTAGEKGTGLGLSITKELVERHEGTIEVTSQVGQGTVFTLSFPTCLPATGQAKAKPAAPVATAPPPEDKPEIVEVVPASEASPLQESGSLSILLVDDNHLNIKLTKTVLEKKGYKIKVAKDGKEALEMYKDIRQEMQRVDLVLMDIQMPVMNGLESTKAIRGFEREKSLSCVPIIAMTAGNSEREKDDCLTSGMNGYISKPFNIKQLDQVLSTLKKTT